MPMFAHTPVRCLALLALSLAALPAWALYKVVQPDGSTTYTDRPPASGNARTTTLGQSAAPAQPELVFPLDLRQAAQRYPVTLYTAANCAPCDSGRQLLVQRGVPYSERRIASDEDAQALERLVGGRTLPALTIGAQPVRGLSETDWNTYLDAAGYPRESRLPRGWAPAPVLPLAERATPPRPAAAPTTPPATPPADTRALEPPTPGGVRF